VGSTIYAAAPPFPHFHRSNSHTRRPGRRQGPCSGVAAVIGAQDPPVTSAGGAGRPHDQSPLTPLIGPGRGCWRAGGRLVAAPWRLPGDPVRSNRYAGEPAAGHQGLLGACCGACVTLDGWPRRVVRSQLRGLPGLKPRTAGNPAGRLTGFCPGAAPGGRAPGPAGTSGAAAGRPGCRACWRLSVASCSAAARPCL
jgi:hypothetical protein